MFNHTIKTEIIEAFEKMDIFIKGRLQLDMNYAKCNQFILVAFTIRLISTITSTGVLLIITLKTSPLMVPYVYQLIFVYFIVQSEAFQMFIFVKGVQIRLALISEYEISATSPNTSLGLLKSSLLKVYDTNQMLQKYFEASFLLNILQNYAAILISSYWIGVAIMEISYAEILCKINNYKYKKQTKNFFFQLTFLLFFSI